MPSKTRKRPRGKAVRADGRELIVHYSPAVAREICERIAAGEAWESICNTGRLPAAATLYTWRRRYPVFAEALAQAREIAAEGVGETPDIFNRLEDPMTDDEDRSDLPVTRKAPGGRKARNRDGAVETVRYGQRISDKICARIASGELWSHFCGTEGYPSWSAFHQWRRDKPEFDAAVRLARRLAGETCLEKAQAVAEAMTPETVACGKAQADIFLKVAANADRAEARRDRYRDEPLGGEPPLRRITIRHFEATVDENGRQYLLPVDQVQVVE